MEERQAHVAPVQNTWGDMFTKKDAAARQALAVDLFVTMFDKTDYQKLFPAVNGVAKEDLPSHDGLAKQGLKVVNHLDCIVNDLGDEGKMKGHLAKFATDHKARSIGPAHIKSMADLFPEFAEKHLGRALTGLERDGWGAVFGALQGCF